MNKKRGGREADQFMARFPDGMRKRLAERAAETGRSMNAELVAAVGIHLDTSEFDRIKSAVREVLREEARG